MNVMVFTVKEKGFTLIELMITVAIVAIVSSIAYSSYNSQIDSTFRRDGQAAMIQLAGALERYHTENNTYVGAVIGANPGSIFSGQVPIEGNNPQYNLALSNLGANTYTITATPVTGARLDGDGNLEYRHTGERFHNGIAGWDN